jgi:Hg(II)-responsive transcriptional regulator
MRAATVSLRPALDSILRYRVQTYIVEAEMQPGTLRIGEVARRTGVNIQTLRYYERRGLLKKPPRTPTGYRQYPSETVRLIRFVKRAQELGFTLKEIKELLRLRDNQRASCTEVRSTAEVKLRDIDNKIDSLRRMRGALRILVVTCRNNASIRECPILEALDLEETKGQRS